VTRFSHISDVYRYLDQLPSFQVHGAVAAKLGLDRIRSFCSRLGDPHRKVPCIHLAGTNGKGSVAVMLALAYQRAGYRCGLYTSPHLLQVRERFRINGAMIPDDEFLRFFRLHGDLLMEVELSYFEITTALAFWWFADQNVDMAILETGLGGRLDATNIVDPEVSVITSIGLDHSNFLGKTITSIATEKAGIIKSGRPVVIGNMSATARKTITEIAHKKRSEVRDVRALNPCHQADETDRGGADRGDAISSAFCRFVEHKQQITVQTDVMAPIHCWNMATARLVTLTAEARFPVSLPLFREAMRSIHSSGMLPGRFEKLSPDLPWYFDGAHNREAVEALMQTIKRQDWKKEPVIVMSIMKDKAEKKMLEPFSVFKKNYYYKQDMERAADIAQITPYVTDIRSLPPTEEEIHDFFNGLTEQVVIFTGSFYFYGVVKRWISRIVTAK